MNLLLDTHVLIWVFEDDPRLPAKVAEAVENAETNAYISAITAWEIAIKITVGKLHLDKSLDRIIETSRYRRLDLSFSSHRRYTELPLLHRDPFDRMLIAQALDEGLTLVTNDRNIRRYDVPILW